MAKKFKEDPEEAEGTRDRAGNGTAAMPEEPEAHKPAGCGLCPHERHFGEQCTKLLPNGRRCRCLGRRVRH